MPFPSWVCRRHVAKASSVFIGSIYIATRYFCLFLILFGTAFPSALVLSTLTTEKKIKSYRSIPLDNGATCPSEAEQERRAGGVCPVHFSTSECQDEMLPPACRNRKLALVCLPAQPCLSSNVLISWSRKSAAQRGRWFPSALLRHTCTVRRNVQLV